MGPPEEDQEAKDKAAGKTKDIPVQSANDETDDNKMKKQDGDDDDWSKDILSLSSSNHDENGIQNKSSDDPEDPDNKDIDGGGGGGVGVYREKSVTPPAAAPPTPRDDQEPTTTQQQQQQEQDPIIDVDEHDDDHEPSRNDDDTNPAVTPSEHPTFEPSQHYIRPGAVAVPGIRGRGDDDSLESQDGEEDDEEQQPNVDDSHQDNNNNNENDDEVLLTASVVPEGPSLQQMVAQELHQQLHQMATPVVAVTEVDNHPEQDGDDTGHREAALVAQPSNNKDQRQKRQRIGMGTIAVLLLIVIIVIAIAVPISQNNNKNKSGSSNSDLDGTDDDNKTNPPTTPAPSSNPPTPRPSLRPSDGPSVGPSTIPSDIPSSMPSPTPWYYAYNPSRLTWVSHEQAVQTGLQGTLVMVDNEPLATMITEWLSSLLINNSTTNVHPIWIGLHRRLPTGELLWSLNGTTNVPLDDFNFTDWHNDTRNGDDDDDCAVYEYRPDDDGTWGWNGQNCNRQLSPALYHIPQDVVCDAANYGLVILDNDTTAGPQTLDTQAFCDNSAQASNGNNNDLIYCINPTRDRWATHLAEAQRRGGTMAAVSTPGIQRALLDGLSRAAGGVELPSLWIGLSIPSLSTSGALEWEWASTNGPPLYTDWSSSFAQRFACIYLNANGDYKFSDARCTFRSFGAIYQFEPTHAVDLENWWPCTGLGTNDQGDRVALVPTASPTATSAPTATSQPTRSPDPLIYCLNSVRLGWKQHLTIARGMAGSLITIENEQVQAIADHLNMNYAWIGLNDRAQGGKYEWASGIPFRDGDYTNWVDVIRNPQPDSNANCVYTASWSKRWGEDNCGYSKSAGLYEIPLSNETLCEAHRGEFTCVDGRGADLTINEIDDDLCPTLSNMTTDLFCFSEEWGTWEFHQTEAVSRGGNLVPILSREINNLLVQKLETMEWPVCASRIWIGLADTPPTNDYYDSGEDQVFEWILSDDYNNDTQNLPMIFSNFNVERPEKSGRCGAMYDSYNFEWIDTSCGHSAQAIYQLPFDADRSWLSCINAMGDIVV